MKSIRFTCFETLPLHPEEIAEQILDLSKWTEFEGYGPLPGIKAAEFVARTPSLVGSRIRVTNRDGSRHEEQIVEWRPEERLQLSMHDFSPPVSRLAKRFVETWEFQRLGNGTAVTRSIELHPKSIAAWPVLWMISILLKKAIKRHLSQLKNQEQGRSR